MQIVKTVEDYNEQYLSISWKPDEEFFFSSYFAQDSEIVLNIDGDQEVICPERFKDRHIVSRLLKERFCPGQEVVISNRCRQADTFDGHLYLWTTRNSQEAHRQSAEEGAFQQFLLDLDFHSCPEDVIRVMMFLLKENKYLISDNFELRESHFQLQKEIDELRELVHNPTSTFLFPDRKFFVNWCLARLEEIERGCSLLQRNYPRNGLDRSCKCHIDYLLQDVNKQYLLVEVIYWDRRLKYDPITNIACLQDAQKYLCKEMSVPENRIRKMILTNSCANGLNELCSINHIELVQVRGHYSVERRV